MKQFSSRSSSFSIDECLEYIDSNDVDEIYCSVSELGNDELSQFVDFADNNLKTLKFIPDNKNIFSRGIWVDIGPSESLKDDFIIFNLIKFAVLYLFGYSSSREERNSGSRTCGISPYCLMSERTNP